MAIEKERKFLLKYLPKEILGPSEQIRQAYILFEGNKHLRVRLVDNDKRKCYLTLKTVHSDIIRTEYEYEIPYADAIEMYQNSENKLSKERYKTVHNGNLVDIDIYEGIDIKVVEIEYTSEVLKDEDIPNYCGVEITGIEKYSNISIAKMNDK